MREQILELVRSERQVSFVQITRLQGARGDRALVAGDTNVVLWDGLSQEAIDAIAGLRRDGLIEYVPTSVQTYVLDGARLKMPLAKSGAAMKQGYKKPHWLPVVIDPVD